MSIVKIKEIEYKGRKVVITDQYGLKKKSWSRLIKLCKKAEKKEKVFSFFPRINFIVTEAEKSDSICFIDGNDLINGKNIVYLNVPVFEEHLLKENWKHSSYFLLVHEVSHLWHAIQSVNFVRAFKASWKLSSRYLSSSKEYLGFNYCIFSFVTKLHSEGMADFIALMSSEKISFDQRTFDHFYQTANSAIKNLNDSLLGVLTGHRPVTGIGSVFHKAAYTIGLHVIYALRFYDVVAIDEIAKMSFNQVIKIYEKTMIKNGKLPVVSFSSNSGIFDYARALAIVKKYYKTTNIDPLTQQTRLEQEMRIRTEN